MVEQPRRARRKSTVPEQDTRSGLGMKALQQAFLEHLHYSVGRPDRIASDHDRYVAAALTVRDRLMARWIETVETIFDRDAKVVAYLSAEFLVGPHLGNNLANLGIYEKVEEALRERGYRLEDLLDLEEEPGLGNGGLGRLAACFLDSLATLEVPAIGYGIRYEFGIFDQVINDGRQVEVSDRWLRWGNPWEIPRPELAATVQMGGRTEWYVDADGSHRVRWIPDLVVKGVPYDTPILGYRVRTCNTLRLWKSEACESFDLPAFNAGDYYGAVRQKVVSENLTKILYPNDEVESGKQLRLEQQFFFASCSLQDMIRLLHVNGDPIERFPERFAVQLNDTHPSVAIPELMRLLVDEHRMDWETAWDIVGRTFSYTNHTLLPEALETWPVELFGRVLPRHLEIVYEINRRFLGMVRARYPGDEARVARMSLIDEGGGRRVRMAHLATVGSHTVNGVSALHGRLLEESVMRDFFELWPEKFTSVTNGVTPRRFVVLANRGLDRLIRERIGESFPTHMEELGGLEGLADDAGFQTEWREVKRSNKAALAALILDRTGVTVDPDSLFDVQVKRLHEYKRQHLNVLHVVTLLQRIRDGRDVSPRTVVFGGKAAPGYSVAKKIIELIHAVAREVDRDKRARDVLRVVFFPDFNVKNAQRIYPAADLSEQISLAGKEASGTGNMKFTMNGAVTIGTLDGANVEIREAVGAENFFLFGLDVEGVTRTKREGYDPRAVHAADAELREAVDAVSNGAFSGGDASVFRPLTDALLQRDEYLVLADYRSYVDCQEEVDRAWRQPERWTRMSVLNVARSGRFSSDRAIREYCERIWKVGALFSGPA